MRGRRPSRTCATTWLEANTRTCTGGAGSPWAQLDLRQDPLGKQERSRQAACTAGRTRLHLQRHSHGKSKQQRSAANASGVGRPLACGSVSTVPQTATELAPSDVYCTVGGGSTACICGPAGSAPGPPAMPAVATAVTGVLPCRCAARVPSFAGWPRSRQQTLQKSDVGGMCLVSTCRCGAGGRADRTEQLVTQPWRLLC